jgi:hypothetical protein
MPNIENRSPDGIICNVHPSQVLAMLLKDNATFYVEKFSCWGRWHKLSLSYVPKDKRRTSGNGDKDLNFDEMIDDILTEC